MKTLSFKALLFLSILGILNCGFIASAQDNATVEQRLTQLENAVANLEEYALLLRYNQIGSVADFEQRIAVLERNFTYIIGEVVQLQPSAQANATAASVGTVTGSAILPANPTPAPATPAATTTSGEYVYLQVGAYNDPTTAASARQRIEQLGYPIHEGSNGQTIRLFLGPFRPSDIPSMQTWLVQQGIDSFPVR